MSQEIDAHQRLADAARALLLQLDPEFSGDMPRALLALAAALRRDPCEVFVEVVDTTYSGSIADILSR